jgi:tetratricopeptide (TPR) repeat protein
VRLNPDYALAHYNLGVTLFALGRPEEALEQYTLALSSEARWARRGGKLRVPSAEEARRWRLGTYVFGGEGWGIDFASVHNNIGNALLALGRHAEAADHLAEAIALRPGFAEAHYNLGIALAGTGRLAEAADSYRRAIALSPRQPDAYNNLGVVLADLGRADEAIGAWREALRLQPAHAAARANLEASLPPPGHGWR